MREPDETDLVGSNVGARAQMRERGIGVVHALVAFDLLLGAHVLQTPGPEAVDREPGGGDRVHGETIALLPRQYRPVANDIWKMAPIAGTALAARPRSRQNAIQAHWR